MDRREKAEGENELSKSAGQLTRKDYERELERLHALVKATPGLTKSAGARICILFEGRDGAGKGGTIKAITERVSPASSASWRCRHRPSARSRRCISNDISLTCRPRARS